MRNPINFLKSPQVLFWIALGMIACYQMPHFVALVQPLLRLDGWISYLAAALMALFVESAILLFLINGDKWTTGVAALGSTILLCAYYQEHWGENIVQNAALVVLVILPSLLTWRLSELASRMDTAEHETETGLDTGINGTWKVDFIRKAMQRESPPSIRELSKELDIPRSTVHYHVQRLRGAFSTS